MCRLEDGTKRYFDDYDSAYDFYINNDIPCDFAWEDNAIEQQVPYTEEVLKGYKCSCGATQ